MSTMLKPDEISFRVLFFLAKTASVPDLFEIIVHLYYVVCPLDTVARGDDFLCLPWYYVNVVSSCVCRMCLLLEM